jgi:uncharacterized membrane protein YfcA
LACQSYIASCFGSQIERGDVDLEIITTLLLSLLGFFAGFLGTLVGVGGGVVVVPLLILLFDLNSKRAVGTSLLMIVFTALSGTLAYFRQKRIDWKVGLVAAVTTVPGAIVGGFATQFVPSRILSIIFGATIFLIAISMLLRSFRKPRAIAGHVVDSRRERVWKRRVVDSAGKVFEYDARIYSGLAFLFLGGLASGFLGIGGGLIVVPIFAAMVGLPIHIAVATSMLTMMFTSVAGVTTHILLGNVLIEYAAPLIVGILIGGQLGARTARQLKSLGLERVFAVAVLLIGIVLILRQLMGV